MDTSNFQPGDRVDAYSIEGVLGHGGMSDVYLARSDGGQEVTLKFPHHEIMGDPATYERFTREIKIGQLLDHPHIQRLLEVGTLDRVPYLVLEYVPGRSLRGFLRECEGGSPERAVKFGVQIGRALAYAHDKGVVHRDMKPENVIVTPDENAKVMDFGIAFVEGAKRVTWGNLSNQVGTPDYMAPEQVKGQRGDERTDIYALGTMVYEIAAGRVPYEGDNALSIMSQHVSAPAPPLSQFAPVSPALGETVMKAIRRDPNGRWPSMQAFVEALEHPDQVDVAHLKAEREKNEAGTKQFAAGGFEGTGVSLGQLALIILGVLIALLLLGVIAQLAHHA